jgi:hypothetical protein
MAHSNIPIRFRFLRLPVAWEVSVSPLVGTVLCGQLRKWESSPGEVRLSELDGWACRDKFFGLQEDDVPGLADFLNQVGAWFSGPDSAALDWSRYPLYAHADEVWQFREDLRDALLDQSRKHFVEQVAPELPVPKTLLDLMAPRPANNFPLRFELSKVAAGVVTIINARQMLFTTVLADVASRISFKTCKRKDCEKPFPIESAHKRKFCSQYCGHLVSQRKKRAAKQRQKRARKSLR